MGACVVASVLRLWASPVSAPVQCFRCRRAERHWLLRMQVETRALRAECEIGSCHLPACKTILDVVGAPKGTTSSSAEENFGFWIDEPTKIVTFADGKKLNVRRFDDRWISAVSGDVSYELDRQSGNLTYAGSTMKDGIATTIIGAGQCTLATVPAR